MRGSWRFLLWLPFLFGLILGGRHLADTLTGEIRGAVLDTETKLVLPAVSVLLRNVDREWQRPAQTDAEGNYVFLQLEPGNHTLTVEKDGYYSITKTDILVRLNQPKVVVPPIELRRLVTTPTQQITIATPEGAKVAVIDMTAPVPTAAVLTYVNERGFTALSSLTDSALRWNYNTSVVHALPLRGGRTFDQLALLAPGVVRMPSGGADGPAVGVGVGTAGQFSVNGLRGRSNNFTVDGSDNNDEDIGVRRQGFVALVPQSVESVEEFQVMTSGFPADFGRNAGSMVNAVSRSGQSAHHGSLYGLFNNDALNARPFFYRPFQDRVNSGINNGGVWEQDRQSARQFGIVSGGPLAPRRLYYFGSVERQDRSGDAVGHFVVPSAAERGLRVSSRAGSFVPIDGLGEFFSKADIGYSDLAGKSVLGLYPLPNNPEGPFGVNTFSQVRRAEAHGSGFSVKTDWYASENHSVAARYNFTNDRSILPFTGDAVHSTLATRTRTQNLSLFLNTTAARFANAVRASYGRTRLAFPREGSSPFLFGSPRSDRLPATFAQVIDTPYGRFGPFGSTGPIGQLSVLPYSTIGIDVFNFPQGRVDNTFQLAEALTWTRSRHTIRAGFEYRRTQLNSFADRNSRPLLVFGYGEVSSDCTESSGCLFATRDGLLHGTDLAALGAPAGFLQAISTQPIPDSTIGLRLAQADFFFQDDWKPHRRVVVNVGLRYELQAITKEANQRIEKTFGLTADQFGKLQPAGQFAGTILGGNTLFDRAVRGLREFLAGRDGIYDPDRNNLAPRAGVAWDALGDGRLSIRAGYGLSYDANLGAVTSQSRNVFPTFVPINLDLNFLQPAGANRGLFFNSPTFLTFQPTAAPLLRPGSLNVYNLGGDAFGTGLGVLFGQAPASPAGNLNSNGLAFTLPEKALETSIAQHWTMSVERAWTPHLLVSATYVGTRGRNLPRFTTPNAGRIATPVLLPSFQGFTLLDFPPSTDPLSNSRPQSGLGGYSVFENSAVSSYHSLQVSVERRPLRGIQLRGSWTWGHVLDEVSDPFDARAFTALPQDVTNLKFERGPANFDARHRVTSYVVWDLPQSSRSLFRGWRLAATSEFQTGQPFTVNTAIDRNLDGNLTDRLGRADGLTSAAHDPRPIRISAGSSAQDLIAPRRQAGRVGRNTFRGDGIAAIDVALSRSVVFQGGSSLELRLEGFNVFNRTHFGIPVRILESPGFGRSHDTTVDPRSVRLYAKFSF